jgi:small conductance mechanosensitive channel
MNFDVNFWRDLGVRAATNGMYIAIIAGLMLAAIFVIRKFSARLAHLLAWRHSENAEIKKRADTFASFIRYLLIFIVMSIGGMMLLKQIGVEIGPILASAGVVGLAVGFGAQNLVQDVISGFFMLLEDQIRVNDVVNVNGKGGLVEKVGLRMIVLRDYDGSAHYIRNGKIDIISNMTKGFGNYVIDVRVRYGEKIERITSILSQIDQEMRTSGPFAADILKPLEINGPEQLAESWLLIRARTTTKPLRQWDVGREFLRRIYARVQAEKIPLVGPRMSVELPKLEVPAISPEAVVRT